VTKVEQYTIMRPVMELASRQVELQHVGAHTIEGRKLESAELSRRLAAPAAVLVIPAGQTIPDYYRPAFKPETLVLTVPPNLPQVPTIAPQPAPPPPDRPVPVPAVKPSSGRGGQVPARLVAQERVGFPTSIPPQLQFATLSEKNQTLNLRSISESIFPMTAAWTRSGGRGGESFTVQINRREFHTTTNSFPANIVDVMTAEGKIIPTGELPQWLRGETLVVVSSDEKPVDRHWLQTVKSNVLVFRAPGASYVPAGGHYGRMPGLAPPRAPVTASPAAPNRPRDTP
jgi:hypothetical protein